MMLVQEKAALMGMFSACTGPGTLNESQAADAVGCMMNAYAIQACLFAQLAVGML